MSEQDKKVWKNGVGRWVWTGCRHAGGFPTAEAAEAALALYPEYYARETPRGRRKEIENKLYELAWGEQR